MSFSLKARRASKADTLEDIAKQMQVVVNQQPAHNYDRSTVLTVCKIYLDRLQDDGDSEYSIDISGNVGIDRDMSVTALAFSVTVQQYRQEKVSS